MMKGCYNIRSTAKKIVEILAEDEIPIKWLDYVFTQVRDIAGGSIVQSPMQEDFDKGRGVPAGEEAECDADREKHCSQGAAHQEVAP